MNYNNLKKEINNLKIENFQEIEQYNNALKTQIQTTRTKTIK